MALAYVSPSLAILIVENRECKHSEKNELLFFIDSNSEIHIDLRNLFTQEDMQEGMRWNRFE
jgi:hypothetical protein